jgi:hypothetical protein
MNLVVTNVLLVNLMVMFTDIYKTNTQNRIHCLRIVNAVHENVQKYMNKKIKLLNSNANIHFNKIHLDLNLTPKYAQ